MVGTLLRLVGIASFWSGTALGATPWRVGTAQSEITPKEPVWMAGYASRNRLPDGTLQPLHAKALFIEDQRGERVVIVTSDLIGVVREVSDGIGRQVEQRIGVKRERLLFNFSHTHSGPLTRECAAIAYGITKPQQEAVQAYTRQLEQTLVELIEKASRSLSPATLAYGTGKATFGMNRRRPSDKGILLAPNPNGPVDHAVPVLRVADESGKLIAVVFGYACHNTTLGGDMYLYNGDYAGFAQEALEKTHPGAEALFMIGCGADTNPDPRGKIELARKHGQSLAEVVDQVLAQELQPLAGPLAIAFDRVELPFAAPPTKEQLIERRGQGSVYQQRLTECLLDTIQKNGSLTTSYSYPVQVIRFGNDLSIVCLAGEVVVDYSHRLQKELAGERVWVAGYCNEVFAYVPSERVLSEGGYEGRDAMVYFGWHGPFAAGVEDRIVGTTVRLMDRCRQAVR